VRDFSMDTLDEVRWGFAKIVELLDTANALVYEELLSVSDPKSPMGFAEATATITANTQDYLYPGNFRKFIRFVQKNTTGDVISEILPTDISSGLSGIVLLDRSRGYRIVPIPTSTQTDWYLQYVGGVTPMLHYGTASAACGAATITFATTPTAGAISGDDGYYVNSYVKVNTATAGAGQKRRITGYLASSKVATVSPAWTTTPTGTVTYEILPCLDYPWDKAIAWRACMMLKGSDADAQHYAMAEREYVSSMRSILAMHGDLQQRFGPVQGNEYNTPEDYGDLFL